jgi:hypothetical protein
MRRACREQAGQPAGGPAAWRERLCRAEGEVIDSIMRRRAGQGRGNRLLRLYRLVFL